MLANKVADPSSLEFTPVPVVNFVFNNETQSFEEATGIKSSNITTRMLTIRNSRMLWRKKFKRFIKKVVEKVVLPVINVVR